MQFGIDQDPNVTRGIKFAPTRRDLSNVTGLMNRDIHTLRNSKMADSEKQSKSGKNIFIILVKLFL